MKKEVDIDNKLKNYLKINNMFRPQKPLKTMKIKLYHTLALPAPFYSSENWTIRARDARRKTAAKMKYMSETAGYTWTDYTINMVMSK